MRLCLALLLGLAAIPGTAAERLRYRFNGLDVDATYARGPEASALVTQFLELAPRSPGGGASAWTTQGSWRQIASLDGRASRVLQVRGEGAGLEAIASTLDTRQEPHREGAAPLWLPPASMLTSQVEFLHPSASTQWVFRSPWHPEALTSWLRLSARLRGWRAGVASSRDLQLSRAAERLMVTVMPRDPVDARGSVVVMTTWRAQ